MAPKGTVQFPRGTQYSPTLTSGWVAVRAVPSVLSQFQIRPLAGGLAKALLCHPVRKPPFLTNGMLSPGLAAVRLHAEGTEHRGSGWWTPRGQQASRSSLPRRTIMDFPPKQLLQDLETAFALGVAGFSKTGAGLKGV